MKRPLLVCMLICTFYLSVQAQEPVKTDSLAEVIITSTRLDLPFKENSKTLQVITAQDIKQSAANNLADLLQQVAGVDIRRRGANGMQADLYIRGGGFDQTLLLIDGIKVEDPQTGHHTLNMALPLEVIERIEIVKGPAARIFGQNAFTGALNIVTKKHTDNVVKLALQAGSYGQKNAALTVGSKLKNSSHIVHVARNLSDGYRYNTDYDYQNYFIKSQFNKQSKMPLSFLANFQERKFGANGFYASPKAVNQYEETQTSLLGVSGVYTNNKFSLKPRLYWRRNQDMYLFVRQDPSVYRNLHISNKIGAEINTSYNSSLGITGFGIDLAKVYLSSNNLGSRNRLMANAFLEHRFKLLNNKLDITPGVAVNYFSDFKFHAFPGLDLGYQATKNLSIYGNVGYTYRIPTYTDLYYNDPTTQGNEDLNPEEALAQELGVKYQLKQLKLTAALFNRDSKKLIDYVKENEADLWQATNMAAVNTKGLETQLDYHFLWGHFNQHLTLGYTYINDHLKDQASNFSKYAINSLKHHFTTRLKTQFVKNLSQSIVYKHTQRATGETYNVYDASIDWTLKQFEISIIANNIFNESYSETNLVPNPKGNVLFGCSYRFK